MLHSRTFITTAVQVVAMIGEHKNDIPALGQADWPVALFNPNDPPERWPAAHAHDLHGLMHPINNKLNLLQTSNFASLPRLLEL